MSSCFKLISSSCIRQTHTLLKKDSSCLLNRSIGSTNSTLAFTNHPTTTTPSLNEVSANNFNHSYVYPRESKSNVFRKHRRVDFQINVPFSKTQERKYSTNVTDNLDILLDPGKNPGENKDIESLFQAAMQKVPQSVVIVTTGKQDKNSSQWIKRGITCSSFTSVSFKPPILSFCIHRHSRMHDLLQETEKFAVHVLAQDQVRQSLHFASSWTNESCPFDTIPHVHGEEGLPIIMGCVAVLLCKTHSIHTVGDHYVYYGSLKGASISHSLQEPLLYFIRSFRSIGDQVFIQAFEDTTLPFEDWTHEAHLRMAWNYIKQYGKEKATPYIKLGIQKYNEKNKNKIKTGYHETITMFFIHLVTEAINDKDVSFEDFLSKNQHLLDNSLLFSYYSEKILSDSEARHRFFKPDKKPLP